MWRGCGAERVIAAVLTSGAAAVSSSCWPKQAGREANLTDAHAEFKLPSILRCLDAAPGNNYSNAATNPSTLSPTWPSSRPPTPHS